MQVVILAAGRGTRMGTLTDTCPKPMLEINGKNLIEYKLEALPEQVVEIIFIVGYKAQVIQNYFGSTYKNKSIQYVIQEELNGSGGALYAARHYLKDTFLILNGDDIYSGIDIENLVAINKSNPQMWGVLGIEMEDAGSAALIETDAENIITAINEFKSGGASHGIVNTGAYLLDSRFFDYPLIPKAEDSSEYGLPQTMLKTGVKSKLVLATKWYSVTSPEDIGRLSSIL